MSNCTPWFCMNAVIHLYPNADSVYLLYLRKRCVRWILRIKKDKKKKSKLRITGFCEGNSPVTGEFPAQMASNAESVSIWWRHHDFAKSASRKYTSGTSCCLQRSPSIYIHGGLCAVDDAYYIICHTVSTNGETVGECNTYIHHVQKPFAIYISFNFIGWHEYLNKRPVGLYSPLIVGIVTDFVWSPSRVNTYHHYLIRTNPINWFGQ